MNRTSWLSAGSFIALFTGAFFQYLTIASAPSVQPLSLLTFSSMAIVFLVTATIAVARSRLWRDSVLLVTATIAVTHIWRDIVTRTGDASAARDGLSGW